MPTYEFLVGVMPPGGHSKRYHRGTVYWHNNDEEAVAERAVEIASERFGYNVVQGYSVVVIQVSEDA